MKKLVFITAIICLLSCTANNKQTGLGDGADSTRTEKTDVADKQNAANGLTSLCIIPPIIRTSA